MNQKLFLPALLSLVVPATTGLAATKVSIADAITACEVAGIKPFAAPVQSKWKQDSSLIGMAYLNFIYQNDLGNPHFCQSMLLMHSQVPAGTANPFVRLFDAGDGHWTLTRGSRSGSSAPGWGIPLIPRMSREMSTTSIVRSCAVSARARAVDPTP